jgi:predicted nicotinamide N-methyase
VFEGGFKIWECSYDLLAYLPEIHSSGFLSSINVLDLGCGSGLPGIFCALSGANSVTFQDYNADVIKGVTIPNYWANLRNRNDLSCVPHFFSGPWDTLCNSISKHEKSYDLILTSETIYNTSHYSSLINIFDFCLSLNGIVLLAAKVNYFGD